MTTAMFSRSNGSAESLPLVVFPVRNHATPGDRAASLRACAERYLPRLGSILFRDFRVDGARQLERFATAFGASVECRNPDALAHDPGTGRMWVACTGAPEACLDTQLIDVREVRGMLSIATRTHLLERGVAERDLGRLLQRAALASADATLDSTALAAVAARLEPTACAEIASAYGGCATRLDWEPGDVLLVDRNRTTVCVPASQQNELLFAIERNAATARIS